MKHRITVGMFPDIKFDCLKLTEFTHPGPNIEYAMKKKEPISLFMWFKQMDDKVKFKWNRHPKSVPELYFDNQLKPQINLDFKDWPLEVKPFELEYKI